MSSSPGQGKECLPPKKRESRQGSAEQGPTDTFKRPAPPWERAAGRRAEQRVEPGEESVLNSCYGLDVRPPMTPPMTPPLPSASPQTQPLPAPAPMYSLPWNLPYPATMATSFISGPCGDNSLVWRGQSASGGDTLELSWSRPLTLQHAGVPIPYRTQFPIDSGDMFTCLPPRQRNYSSHHSQITQAQLFSRPPTYSREPFLHDKTALPAKRPNGFDRRDSWYLHAGKSLDRQGNGRSGGWENQESPRSEGKRSCHEYRQYPTQALCEDAKNIPPLPQGKDLWVTPRAPPAKSSETRGTVYDFPGQPRQAGHVHYALPPPSCAVSQQRPLEHPRHIPPTLRNTELSLLVEKRHVEAPRSRIEGPNGNHPRQDPQRISCPSPRGHGPKAQTGTPIHTPKPSPLTPRPPTVLPYFRKGSLIELSGGRLKRVEELQTDDFLLCPDPSPDIHLSSCTILMISPSPDPAFSRLQVLLPDHSTQELLEVLVEYPFFIRDRGWSSCCPRRTAQLYELCCHQLRVGDVCLALTPSPSPERPSSPSLLAPPMPAGKGRDRGGGAGSGPRNTHSKAGEEKLMPPSPPPAPLGELPRKRKRHWSAPELQGVSMTPVDLPHSSKHRRQQ